MIIAHQKSGSTEWAKLVKIWSLDPRMKILIADDDPIGRRLLQRRLTQWNYEVIAANDGQEAWQLLQQPDKPALAIFDWDMPGLNGVKLCSLAQVKDNFTTA